MYHVKPETENIKLIYQKIREILYKKIKSTNSPDYLFQITQEMLDLNDRVLIEQQLSELKNELFNLGLDKSEVKPAIKSLD